MNKYLVLIAALFVSLPAASAPDEQVVQAMTRQTSLTAEQIRGSYDACDSGVTSTMKICASYNWMVQDVRMNKVYKQAIAKARVTGYEKSMVKAQRAWLAYRDATCALEGEMGAGGGTAEGLYVLSCKEEVTKQQAERLEATLHE